MGRACTVAAMPTDLACTTPLMAPALPDADADAMASALKAIADPNRVKILHRLVSSSPNGVCVCDLAEPLGIGQPSVSHHLRVLRQAGLVERRREARFAYYTARVDALQALARLIAPAA